jgi:proliferating cell nuclear antigen
MLEAKLSEGAVFKKIIDSLKDLFTDVQFEFSSGGMSLQAMESSHVVLAMLLMRSEAFESYRCDRTMPIGINIVSLSKIIKCCGNDDSITIKADDGGETINFVFESKNGERVSDYDLKLMDLDVECLGIEESEPDVGVQMPSDELQRICRDLSNISESVEISAVKDSIKFATKGDLGSGNIIIRSSAAVDKEEKAQTKITMRKPVNSSVSLKFLSAFTKATGLSPTVKMEISDKQPLLVEYSLGEVGHVRFYLAPKLGEDE